MDSFAITDKGIVRNQNQDFCYTSCDQEKGISVLLVCDGMGGARAGNVASELAEKVFINELEGEDLSLLSQEELAKKIENAIGTANTAVYELSTVDPDCAGMGTTLVAAVIIGRHATIVNVGDSRAYHITGGEAVQVTRDHSLVEDMIERGELTREESRVHPNKNLITRAVGTAPSVECDLFEFDILEDEYVLLCSDGLTNLMSDAEISETVSSAADLKTACTKLVLKALDRKAPDNVTVVLFKI